MSRCSIFGVHPSVQFDSGRLYQSVPIAILRFVFRAFVYDFAIEVKNPSFDRPLRNETGDVGCLDFASAYSVVFRFRDSQS